LSLEKLNFDSLNVAFNYACYRFRKHEAKEIDFGSKDDIIFCEKYAPVFEGFYDAFAKRFCELIDNYNAYAFDVWAGDGNWLLKFFGIDKCVERLRKQIVERLKSPDDKMSFLLNSLSVLLIQYKVSYESDEVSLVLPENIEVIYEYIFSEMLNSSCGNKSFVQSCMISLYSCKGYLENVKYADVNCYPQRLQGKSVLLNGMNEIYNKLQAQVMDDLKSGKIKGIVQTS
jgi:hypothetical protein